jgi:hypothetical protein
MVAAEKSRMMVGGLRAYYSMGRTRQAFTRLTGPLSEKGAKAPSPFFEPYRTLPNLAMPRRAATSPNRLMAAGRAWALRAAVCNYCPAQSHPAKP